MTVLLDKRAILSISLLLESIAPQNTHSQQQRVWVGLISPVYDGVFLTWWAFWGCNTFILEQLYWGHQCKSGEQPWYQWSLLSPDIISFTTEPSQEGTKKRTKWCHRGASLQGLPVAWPYNPFSNTYIQRSFSWARNKLGFVTSVRSWMQSGLCQCVTW